MINKISIKGPASYKNMAVFETDKNINGSPDNHWGYA